MRCAGSSAAADAARRAPARAWLAAGCAALLAAVPAWCADAAVTTAELPSWRAQLLPPADGAWRRVPQEFTFNNESEPKTLDPALMTGVLESRLALALFEGLVTYDPRTLAPRPGLATAWDISPDLLTYTFHLRPQACFSDGSPIDSGVVRRSWLRALDPATAAEYAYQLFPVAGAEAFHAKPGLDPALVQVDASDPRTLVVHLAHPCPYFLDLCAFPTLAPVPLERIARWGAAWTEPEHIACSGPFLLTQWLPDEQLVMEANPRYWDAGHVTLRRLTALPYSSSETAYKKYLSGGLDWTPGAPVTKMNELLRNPDYYITPYLGVYYYRFNCTRPPFDDVRVRQAFDLAIDRTIITEHVTRGGQLPATWFCPDCAGYHHVPGLTPDPDRARALLAAAGYGPGRPFPTVELLTNNAELHLQVAESVVQQWRDVLGVQVSLQKCEWKVYLDRIDRLDYQIARASWIGDYGDPNTFFDLWLTDGGNNHTGWSCPAYDQALLASQREADPVRRLAEFARCEHLLVEDQLPIMPLYIYVNQGLLSAHVHGWYENVRDIHPWQYVWLE